MDESSFDGGAEGSVGSKDLSPGSRAFEHCRQIGASWEPFSADNNCIGSPHTGQGVVSSGGLGCEDMIIQGQAIESAEVSGWSCPVLYLGELAECVSLVRFKESFGIFRVSPLEGCLEPLCFLGHE